jgi:hypothetical protein
MKPAIQAWPGSTLTEVRPDPNNDGIAFIAFKVTNPSPGVWHYEYAIYNQNLDRGIQSFSVPTGSGVSLTNIGFHAPPQHPGWSGDGTTGNTGFTGTPWAPNQTASALSWSSEPISLNTNANALRWGTLYNFRFDSNRPPQTVSATIGFFKTGSPITVQVQGPSPAAAVNVSVSGRVTGSSGQPLRSVYVFLIDSSNNVRTAITSPFGFYSFDNVLTGQTYTIGATSKRYSFPAPTMLTVSDNVTNQDIMALP